jgi:hypothetical protein
MAILVISIFIVILCIKIKTTRNHKKFNKKNVITALNNVLSNDLHDEWDLFLTHPINDKYLESVRVRCIDIVVDYSNKNGSDLSEEGKKIIKKIIQDLEEKE